MKGGEHPWQKNWQEPRELCLGPQGSCCRLLSGKSLLDLCCCVWPTSSQSFLPCITCLCFREKCLCAPPGTGRVKGQPLGSSGGKCHQKLLFYQHCTEGKGNSSKGSQSPIRKATRKDTYSPPFRERVKYLDKPTEGTQRLVKTGLLPWLKEEKIVVKITLFVQ